MARGKFLLEDVVPGAVMPVECRKLFDKAPQAHGEHLAVVHLLFFGLAARSPTFFLRSSRSLATAHQTHWFIFVVNTANESQAFTLFAVKK